MRPNFITHTKDGVSLSFRLEDITFMKHQHATLTQKEMHIVIINTQLKMFINKCNYDKIFEYWTSEKPIKKGRILTLQSGK